MSRRAREANLLHRDVKAEMADSPVNRINLVESLYLAKIAKARLSSPCGDVFKSNWDLGRKYQNLI